MKKTEEIYREMIENKNVILIGPGRTDSIIDKYFFDKYDTIIRCGQVLPIDKNNTCYYGEKTDILYNSLDNHPLSGGRIDKMLDIWKKENVKIICSTYPKKEWFYKSDIEANVQEVNKHIPVKDMDDNLYFYYKKILDSRPNSGFCAFIDILSHHPKNMHIIGIDFFRSLCYDSYKPEFSMGKWTHKDFLKDLQPGPTEHHDPDKQYGLYKKICISNEHIISVDDTIKKIFEDSKMDNIFGDFL